MERNSNVKFLVNAGLMIAIATILSYVIIIQMPQGGSVTAASMVPIFMIAFKYGTKKGIFVGAVYGLLQALLQGTVIHPAQFILDYPLAFALLGIAGIFSKNLHDRSLSRGKKIGFIVSGTFLGVLLRYICHVLSGAIFFKEYAGAQNPWVYSAVYNAGYLGLEFIITAVVSVLLLSVFEKFIYKNG